MGLGAPKKRTKLSHDPNNTNWARNTANYGHKILASQGWQPGQYLGAENANHAAHYTAANASHIRVMLREDNLGLGAQRGTSNAETFGLSTLSGIFGRLNGKSEGEVQKVQETQRDLGLRSWQAQRFGFMNFVSGGLLVGDKMEESGQEKAAAESKDDAVPNETSPAESQKKRKAEDPDASVDSAAASKKKRKAEKDAEGERGSRRSESKKKSKSKSKHRSESSDSESESEPAANRKKDKKRSKDLGTADGAKQNTKPRKPSKPTMKDESAIEDKARLKEEKRARKEDRRKRKEEKRRLKGSGSSKLSRSAPQSRDQSESSDENGEAVAEAVVAPTPVAQAMAFGGSRHAVRQRYIQQKRMAAMNPQAMQEILMLKAAG